MNYCVILKQTDAFPCYTKTDTTCSIKSDKADRTVVLRQTGCYTKTDTFCTIKLMNYCVVLKQTDAFPCYTKTDTTCSIKSDKADRTVVLRQTGCYTKTDTFCTIKLLYYKTMSDLV